jgi:hypothetical protein
LEERETEDQSSEDDVETGRNLLLAVSSARRHAEIKQKRDESVLTHRL